VIGSGKILSGFHIVRAMALGADVCNSARAMMMAVGCIQALLCNTNACPTGVATQDPELTAGLVVEDKKQRVANFHKNTVTSFVELMCAAGISDPSNINRHDIYRRVFMNQVRSFEDIYPTPEKGVLLSQNIPDTWRTDMKMANIDGW
jgi:glutamate synthase domain-containing protein 2